MDFDTAMRDAITDARAVERPHPEDRSDDTARTVVAFVRERPVVGLEWRRVVQAVVRREGAGAAGNLTGQRDLHLARLDWEGMPHDRHAEAAMLDARARAIFGDWEGTFDDERVAAFYRALPNSEPWQREADGAPTLADMQR